MADMPTLAQQRKIIRKVLEDAGLVVGKCGVLGDVCDAVYDDMNAESVGRVASMWARYTGPPLNGQTYTQLGEAIYKALEGGEK